MELSSIFQFILSRHLLRFYRIHTFPASMLPVRIPVTQAHKKTGSAQHCLSLFKFLSRSYILLHLQLYRKGQGDCIGSGFHIECCIPLSHGCNYTGQHFLRYRY